jgi:hypothetical protein
VNAHDIVSLLIQWITPTLIAFIVAGLVDWAVGSLKAMTDGTFSLQKFPEQIVNIFMPYLTPMVAALLATPVIGDWRAIVTPFAATATIKLLDDIRQKLMAFFAPKAAPAAAPAK